MTPALYPHATPETDSEKNLNLAPDWTSVVGRFGWLEIDGTHFPYLVRSGQKLLSETWIFSKLSKHRKFFSNEVHTCFTLKRFKVTPAEVNLLNDINFRHSDCSYGNTTLTMTEHLIPAEDAEEMHYFYKFCYEKLYGANGAKAASTNNRSGYIRIDSQNAVPYVRCNGAQYVPVFYFEGDAQSLEKKATTVSGWDLTYLKFAFKVQGIRQQLFEGDALKVVRWQYVQELFPKDTKIEEYDLYATGEFKHLQCAPPGVGQTMTDKQKKEKLNGNVQQKAGALRAKTKLYKPPPSTVPVSTVPVSTAELATQYTSAQNNAALLSFYQQQLPSTQFTSVYSQAQPNTTVAQPGVTSFNYASTRSTEANVNVLNFQDVIQNTLAKANHSQSGAFDPGAIVSLSQQSPLKQVQNSSESPANPKVPMVGCNQYVIPEVYGLESMRPYEFRNVVVHDRVFNSINMIAFDYRVLLVSLEEVSWQMNNIVVLLDKKFKELNVTVYLPNKLQKELLKTKNINFPYLVKVEDLMKCIPELNIPIAQWENMAPR